MRHVFIINPVSGKADATIHLLPLLTQAAQQAGIEYTTETTSHVGHAAELAKQYAETGEPVRLYACGGDGTLNEIFEGASPFSNAEVASVPCGSGNDFVRSFGRTEDFLDLADNLAGTAIPIDLIAANGRVSAAICSVGIDSEIAYGIPRFRRIPLCGGQMAYNLSIVQRLCRPIGNRLRVEIDGQVYEDNYLIATVCNGKTYGGGYCAAPMADLQDGMLEVILVKKMGRLRVAKVLAIYKVGKHIQNGEVIPSMRDIMFYHRGKDISITPVNGKPAIVNIDGECGPAPELTAHVMPLAAKFVLPKRLYTAFCQTKKTREAES